MENQGQRVTRVGCVMLTWASRRMNAREIRGEMTSLLDSRFFFFVFSVRCFVFLAASFVMFRACALNFSRSLCDVALQHVQV